MYWFICLYVYYACIYIYIFIFIFIFIDELGPPPPPNSPPSQISDMTYAEFHDVSRHALKSAAGVLYLAPSVMQRLSFGLWSKQEPIADGTALPMTPTLLGCCKSGAPPS